MSTFKLSKKTSLAKALRNAIGAKPDEDVIVYTPQFDRADGSTPAPAPKTAAEFDALKKLSNEKLWALGLRRWDGDLWLFPHEWYNSIPNGYKVIDINFSVSLFCRGKTDDDKRNGCLAYGIVTTT